MFSSQHGNATDMSHKQGCSGIFAIKGFFNGKDIRFELLDSFINALVEYC